MNRRSVNKLILEAVDLLGVPYIWGGNDPALDDGLDCSGFIGYIFRQIGYLPPGFDRTAQGYHRLWRRYPAEAPERGCVAFYGRNVTRITHIMLIVAPGYTIGAVRGNKWTDTVEKARAKSARVDSRPLRYRGDLVAVVNPFLKEV